MLSTNLFGNRSAEDSARDVRVHGQCAISYLPSMPELSESIGTHLELGVRVMLGVSNAIPLYGCRTVPCRQEMKI